MDERLEVKDPRRPLAHAPQVNVPLASLAWDAMQTQHHAWAAVKSALEAETEKLVRALVPVADEMIRLQRESKLASSTGAGGKRAAASLAITSQRLEQALKGSGLTVLAPVGEPMSGDLAELFENAGTTPKPGISAPVIAEVLMPAVLHGGRVIRTGKALVGIPAPTVKQPGMRVSARMAKERPARLNRP